jgi:hypothetical protein
VLFSLSLRGFFIWLCAGLFAHAPFIFYSHFYMPAERKSSTSSTKTIAAMPRRVARALRRNVGVIFIVAWLLLVLFLFSDAGHPFSSILVAAGFATFWLAVWLARAAASSLRKRRRDGFATGERLSGKQLARRWGVEPFAFLIIAALAYSGAFASARFILSASALERHAREASKLQLSTQSLGSPTFAHPPKRVGLYRIRATEPLPEGAARFITSDSGLFDTAGFAFHPNTPPKQADKNTYERVSTRWWKWTSAP